MVDLIRLLKINYTEEETMLRKIDLHKNISVQPNWASFECGLISGRLDRSRCGDA